MYQCCCNKCRHATCVTLRELLTRVRQDGYLRRDNDVSTELLLEVARIAAGNWQCEKCRVVGLVLEAWLEDTDWDDGRKCRACGKSIPAERLEIFPNAMHCVQCENRVPQERDDDPPFCPRCSSKLEVQRSRQSGASRYVYACPICPPR